MTTLDLELQAAEASLQTNLQIPVLGEKEVLEVQRDLVDQEDLEVLER